MRPFVSSSVMSWSFYLLPGFKKRLNGVEFVSNFVGKAVGIAILLELLDRYGSQGRLAFGIKVSVRFILLLLSLTIQSTRRHSKPASRPIL